MIAYRSACMTTMTLDAEEEVMTTNMETTMFIQDDDDHTSSGYSYHHNVVSMSKFQQREEALWLSAAFGDAFSARDHKDRGRCSVIQFVTRNIFLKSSHTTHPSKSSK